MYNNAEIVKRSYAIGIDVSVEGGLLFNLTSFT
jgi:hypothetical protein